jgi:hypothetical protein
LTDWQDDAATLALKGAQVVVTAMASSAWSALKAKILPVLGRNDETRRVRDEKRLEVLRAEVISNPESGPSSAVAQLEERFLALTDLDPEGIERLARMLNEIEADGRLGPVAAQDSITQNISTKDRSVAYTLGSGTMTIQSSNGRDDEATKA